MKYWIKRKIWQIKNVIRWLPIIWKQFDFDYRYSIDVFKFQLQKQAEFLESDRAHTMSAKQNAMRIRTVIKLMEKVYDGEYACEYQDRLKEKYGEGVLKWEFRPAKEEGYFEMRHRYQDWPNSDEVEKDHDAWFLESRAKQERAHRLLWQLIEKDIQKWWD